jgi:hypothetical protein
MHAIAKGVSMNSLVSCFRHGFEVRAKQALILHIGSGTAILYYKFDIQLLRSVSSGLFFQQLHNQ